jgi:hypothetical protein
MGERILLVNRAVTPREGPEDGDDYAALLRRARWSFLAAAVRHSASRAKYRIEPSSKGDLMNKKTPQVQSLLLHRSINALAIRVPACLCLLLVAFGSAEVTAQSESPPRGEQRVAMTQDLSFAVAPPWRLVGDRRNWVNELQITNDTGLLVARAVINLEKPENRRASAATTARHCRPRATGRRVVPFPGVARVP